MDERIIVDFKIDAVDGNDKLLSSNDFKDIIIYGGGNFDFHRFIKLDHFSKELNSWKENVLTLRCEMSSKIFNPLTVSGCESRTIIGVDHCTFEWNLNIPDSSEWKIRKTFYFLPVLIEIVLMASEGKIEIVILKTKEMAPLPRLFLRFSLLDVNGKEVISKCDTRHFLLGNSNALWKFPSFLTKKKLLEEKNVLLQNDSFTLKCEILIANEKDVSYIENYIFHPLHAENLKSSQDVKDLKPEIKIYSRLQYDMRDMLAFKKYCDVKLRVENKTILAHKALLAARSPVFRAMFDQDMLESKTGVVDIQDSTVDTMNSLLEFIYTDSVEDLEYESALGLLVAADKYQVLGLTEKCSTILSSVLSVSNVCDVLVMADMLGYSPLKTSAMDYIMKNYEKIMASPEWPKWVQINSVLGTEVLLKLSNCLRNGKD